MSERLHWNDQAGAVCGRAHPINPKFAARLSDITCKSCAKKLGVMLAEYRHFSRLVREETK